MSEIQLEDILEKIKTNPICNLTGRLLDVENTNSWHLDHIIPSSRGGDNSLENCQIVCADVNRAKSGLLQEDFIQLCLDVVKHHGYKVEKSNTEDRCLRK